MKVTDRKDCYCHTCNKWFHYLGITRHRAMHRDKKEACEITFSKGDTYGKGLCDAHDLKNKSSIKQ